MKTPIYLSTIFLAALMTFPQAQTPPHAVSYQALVRDGAGLAIKNQLVGLRIQLRPDSANATVTYAETFTPTTNGFGNVNLSIGRGSVVSGSFAALDWSRPMYVEVGVDIAGGTTYASLGTTQLLSVPYALYAGRSATSASATNASEIRDADNNTKVTTERNTNEDIIRFDLNGTEKMRLRGNALEFPNSGLSVYIGDSAGTNAGPGNLRNVFVGYRSGRSNSTGRDNSFSGYYSGFSNTTGGGNTFSGSFAGSTNTTGTGNTFSGYGAGLANSGGNSNTFAGYGAGASNTTGNDNTFSGFGSGFSNTTGNNNAFFGDSAGHANTTGSYNTFAGYQAGLSNTTGIRNTFLGYQSGYNSTGNFNTFLGHQTGFNNTTGTNNTFVGHSAGLANTTGIQNTFSGYLAGLSNTTGGQNIFTGSNAGGSNTTGNQNVFTGFQSGYSTSSGGMNAFYGHASGFYNTTGNRNTYLGFASGSPNINGAVDSGNVFIGAQAGVIGSNKLAIANAAGVPLVWGDFAADSVRINGGLWVARTVTGTAFVNSSDRRLKENIAPIPSALDGVGKMNGVYYNYKSNAPDGNAYPKSRQIGVIAQDVEKFYPELVMTQPGGYKAVDYPKLTAVLIEAVKELRKENQELRAEHAARLEKIEAALRLSGKSEDKAKMAGR